MVLADGLGGLIFLGRLLAVVILAVLVLGGLLTWAMIAYIRRKDAKAKAIGKMEALLKMEHLKEHDKDAIQG